MRYSNKSVTIFTMSIRTRFICTNHSLSMSIRTRFICTNASLSMSIIWTRFICTNALLPMSIRTRFICINASLSMSIIWTRFICCSCFLNEKQLLSHRYQSQVYSNLGSLLQFKVNQRKYKFRFTAIVLHDFHYKGTEFLLLTLLTLIF